MQNVSQSKKKFGYIYVLTPQGIAEKAMLTTHFLKLKMAEYDALKLEIDTLTSEMNKPQVILAGRRINDGMAACLAQQTIKQMIGNGTKIKGAKVIVLGLTFKENCSDLRNSKVADVVKELRGFGCEVHVHDPLAEPEQALHEYGIALSELGQLPHNADAIVAAESHAEYTDKPIAKLLESPHPPSASIRAANGLDAGQRVRRSRQLGRRVALSQHTRCARRGAATLLWDWSCNPDRRWRKARTNNYSTAAPDSAAWPGRY